MNKTSNSSSPKQGSMLYKRPRNYNFTIAEKMHFLDCLQHYIDVTENRRLDSSTIVQKKRTWEVLVTKYNKKFPNGPQRNYAQLKDLYRRMKITARKVHKRRTNPLSSADASPIVTDAPTERLIQMMFSVSTLEPSDFLDLELREHQGDEEDVKPIIGRDIPDLTSGDCDASVSDGQICSNEYSSAVEVNGDSTSHEPSSPPTMIWTENGEIKLPTDLVITEMRSIQPTESVISSTPADFSSIVRRRLARKQDPVSRKGISSEELNFELLQLARREHEMKMRVHEANLEVLKLHKKKLQKELGIS